MTFLEYGADVPSIDKPDFLFLQTRLAAGADRAQGARRGRQPTPSRPCRAGARRPLADGPDPGRFRGADGGHPAHGPSLGDGAIPAPRPGARPAAGAGGGRRVAGRRCPRGRAFRRTGAAVRLRPPRLRRGPGGGPAGGGGAPAGPRAPVQRRLRKRDRPDRSAPPPADRGLRADAEAGAAALPARRRRRRRQDHHDRPLRAGDAVPPPHPQGADRDPGRPRGQLGARAPHPLPAAMPHRVGSGRPGGRQPLLRPGWRPGRRLPRHPRERTRVRGPPRPRGRPVRPGGVRRGPQAERLAHRKPGHHDAPLPPRRGAGRRRAVPRRLGAGRLR